MKEMREPTNRAAQFSAFDALKGYDELIELQKKIPEQKPEIVEEDAEKINATLSKIEKKMVVSVQYFHVDHTVSLTGPVQEIIPEYHTIKVGNIVIPFENLCGISIVDTSDWLLYREKRARKECGK